MSEEKKFAVLIDAENISSRYIKIIVDEITNHGVITYRRIYGDWTDPKNHSWKSVLLDNSITPIQQYSYTSGKNATDSALIIDAMDILYSGDINGFCLVSSDSDFTRLAVRLREAGKDVIGMGEYKTPKAFISACNQFKYLDILYEQAEKEEKEDEHIKSARSPRKRSDSRKNGGASPGPQTKVAAIRRALKTIIEESSDEDGWISSSDLGNQLAKKFPDFDVRNYGYKKLTLFIESLGDFELERFHPSPGSRVQKVQVRLKD